MTKPVGDTFASWVSEDSHVALRVTSWVLPSDSRAVAVNWNVGIEAEGAPVTVTATRRLATDRCIDPVTFWYVARTSSSPLPTTVTKPVDDTAATLGFDDSHAAMLVTSREVPSDNRATAVN